MPNLNERQFQQLSLDRDVGPLQRTEFSGKGAALDSIVQREAREAKKAEARKPGSDYHRGNIPGQGVLNFDAPEYRLEYANPDRGDDAAAIIEVSAETDPDFRLRMFNVGGALRYRAEVEDADLLDEDLDIEPGITAAWKKAPVETFGPNAEIRSGQPNVDSEKVDYLRHTPYEDYHDTPWIARVAGKNYMLEGHHRATAARRSRTGEFDAHVIEADSAEDLVKKVGRRGASAKASAHRRHGEPRVVTDDYAYKYVPDSESWRV